MSIKPNIIVAGLCKNNASYLKKIFDNLDNIISIASETAFIFLENDSLDDTKNELEKWGKDKNNFRLITINDLDKVIPIRTVRLELLRNLYVEIIKKDDNLLKYDLLMVIDMDDAFCYPINQSVVLESINFIMSKNENAAIFSNQIGIYYDMWALRHKTICNVDIWEEVFDYVREKKVTDAEAFNATFQRKIFSINIDNNIFEVDSAFGGYGIYKLNYIINNKSPYLGSKVKILELEPNINICRWSICEHVNFHHGIQNQGGKLFINPKMITGEYKSIEFPAYGYRNMIF